MWNPTWHRTLHTLKLSFSCKKVVQPENNVRRDKGWTDDVMKKQKKSQEHRLRGQGRSGKKEGHNYIYFSPIFNIWTPLSLFQGCILLQGCQVNELTANPDEPGRHLFEIVPGERSISSSRSSSSSTTFTYPWFNCTSISKHAQITWLATVNISVLFIYFDVGGALVKSS